MLRVCIVYTSLFFLLAGCAVNQQLDNRQRPVLKQSYSQFDLKMTWDVTLGDSDTRIDGIIENTRSTRYEEMELWVDLRDRDDNSISRKSFLFSGAIRMNEPAPFTVFLPVRAASGSKLVFTYRYVPVDGGDTEHWMQSFEAGVPDR